MVLDRENDQNETTKERDCYRLIYKDQKKRASEMVAL